MAANANSRCKSVPGSVCHIRGCEDLQVESTVVDPADFGGGECAGREYRIHDVEISLSLEWLDVEVGDLEGAFNTLKEFSYLWDPEAF